MYADSTDHKMKKIVLPQNEPPKHGYISPKQKNHSAKKEWFRRLCRLWVALATISVVIKPAAKAFAVPLSSAIASETPEIPSQSDP